MPATLHWHAADLVGSTEKKWARIGRFNDFFQQVQLKGTIRAEHV
jgi:hypothetical protein